MSRRPTARGSRSSRRRGWCAPARQSRGREMDGPDLDDSALVVCDATDTAHFRGHRCRACGSTWFPQRTYCAHCRSRDLEPWLLPVEGTLYSYSVVHRGRPGVRVPYAVGSVIFTEHVAVFGRILGWEDGIEIGQRVRARIAPADERSGDPRSDYRMLLVRT
ncbi:MAG: hypothetical protein GEV10_27050 [Streptosporangiales bacterium]|nr:hypothetical protein [Streptosporangiales bacterium]